MLGIDGSERSRSFSFARRRSSSGGTPTKRGSNIAAVGARATNSVFRTTAWIPAATSAGSSPSAKLPPPSITTPNRVFRCSATCRKRHRVCWVRSPALPILKMVKGGHNASGHCSIVSSPTNTRSTIRSGKRRGNAGWPVIEQGNGGGTGTTGRGSRRSARWRIARAIGRPTPKGNREKKSLLGIER